VCLDELESLFSFLSLRVLVLPDRRCFKIFTLAQGLGQCRIATSTSCRLVVVDFGADSECIRASNQCEMQRAVPVFGFGIRGLFLAAFEDCQNRRPVASGIPCIAVARYVSTQ
jgi:hypothetical protein